MGAVPTGAPQLPPISFIRLRRFMPSWAVDGDWSKGMVRDTPRAAIPVSGVYNAVDWILDQPAFAYKRGGTAYAGPAMTSATYAQNCIYADFAAGSQILGVGSNGHLYKVTSGATTDVGTMGTAYQPICKPVFHNGGTKQYVIIPTSDGSAAFMKYNGSSVAAGVASAPHGTICSVYKSRLVLANDGSKTVRIWFSPVTVASGADIDQTWDTTNAWVDAQYPVVGLAPLQNMLLIFSHHATERLSGTTPPPGSDFDHAPVGNVGCTDARSISLWQNYAIFANNRSIYMTNGVGFKDLLADAGLVSYWQSLLTGYVAPGVGNSGAGTFAITTGILWQKYLFVVVMNGSTFVDCLVCNLPKNAWWRWSNIQAASFSTAVDIKDELYYADRSTNRLVTISGCWLPAAGNKNDANGTAVAPVLETRVIAASPGIKNYGLGRVAYDLRDAASDNPTMAVTVAAGLEAPTFTAVPESPLAETTNETRTKVTLAKLSQGLTVRLTQSGPSASTQLYALEHEVMGLGEEYG